MVHDTEGLQLIPFVILSVARSGTSLLASTLRQHRDIYCHGEIFHEKTNVHIQPELLERIDMRLRESDPLRFVQEVLAFSPGRRIVGFKMWRSQHRDVCDHILSDPTIKKIVLERENRLASFSSVKLARQTGTWNVPGEANPARLAKIRKEKVDFDKDEFLKYKRRTDHMFNLYRNKSRGSVAYISYLDLAKGHFDEVLSFLGAEIIDLKPQKRRLHSSDIVSRFRAEYHEAILKTLEEIDRVRWRNE